MGQMDATDQLLAIVGSYGCPELWDDTRDILGGSLLAGTLNLCRRVFTGVSTPVGDSFTGVSIPVCSERSTNKYLTSLFTNTFNSIHHKHLTISRLPYNESQPEKPELPVLEVPVRLTGQRVTLRSHPV